MDEDSVNESSSVNNQMRLFEISPPLAPTEENIEKAKDFVFDKWKERAAEMGRSEPTDLTSACKFASLFAQKVFGGTIRGNAQHQYVVVGDKIVDLTADAGDVQKLLRQFEQTRQQGWYPSGYGWDEWRGHPHAHDASFLNNPEHRQSMRSCRARVDQWVAEFIDREGKRLPR